ncbi:MAG: hypothetical protein QOF73_3262 [Thermomicrobiales bacterium]|jgi:hypothetical protein|nr:hypothetical protein [Thermomicrobiales bacterium]
MNEEAMRLYVEELVRERAQEVAAETGTTVEEELDSPAYAAIRATMVYAVRLLQANNAYLTRHLLDLGLLQTVTAEAPETPTEDATAPTE